MQKNCLSTTQVDKYWAFMIHHLISISALNTVSLKNVFGKKL